MGHANQQRSIKFTDVPDDPSMLLLQSRNTTYEYLQILGFKAASFAEDPDLRAVYDIFVGRYNHIMYEYHDEMGRDVRYPRGFDLRDLLRTYNTDKYGVEPIYGGLWVRFMQDELGLDGVVFNETGEGKDFKSAPTYTIYNPQIILDQQIQVIES